MLKSLRGAALAVVLTAAPIYGAAQSVNFADTPIGQRPDTIEPMLSGNGGLGRWAVGADNDVAGARALAQLDADPTPDRYPLAVFMPTVPADIEVTVGLKLVSGKLDQAGGVVVRLQSPQNYYVARVSALENNVRFYRIAGGRRDQLASVDHEVKRDVYQRLTLRAQGDRFTVLLNGEQLFTANDSAFKAPGKVGLWTEADSITRFDKIEIKPLE